VSNSLDPEEIAELLYVSFGSKLFAYGTIPVLSGLRVKVLKIVEIYNNI